MSFQPAIEEEQAPPLDLCTVGQPLLHRREDKGVPEAEELDAIGVGAASRSSNEELRCLGDNAIVCEGGGLGDVSLSDDEASGSVERGGVCWKTAQPAPRTLPLDCPLRGGKGGEGACGSRVDEIVPAVTLLSSRVTLRCVSLVADEVPAVDASFRPFITDVIREGFDAHHLEFEGFRAGLACLELRRPTSGLSNSSGHSGLTGPC